MHPVYNYFKIRPALFLQASYIVDRKEEDESVMAADACPGR